MSAASNYFLFVDALMVGVIWSVQLLIYPSFAHFSREGLRSWHDSYTGRITVLVAPLMLGQLGFGIFWGLTEPGLASLGYAALIVLLWALTFLAFVPLHRRISQGSGTGREPDRLVSLNWIRTFLWTFALLWHLHFTSSPFA